MKCLENYIGIRWCKVPEPESGLWLNDLPGISLKALDKSANEEQASFLEVWNTIQRRSLQRFSTAVINEFAKRYRLNRITETATWPKVISTSENQTAPNGDQRGFIIAIGWPEPQTALEPKWLSPLQVMHVQSLSLYLKNAAPALNIKFWNLQGNTITELTDYTILYDAVAGWNEIPVNKDFYDVQRLLVTYDGTGIESVFLPLDTTTDCINCNISLNICDGSAWIQGAVLSGIDGTVSLTNNTYGLSAVVSARCKFEQVVCNNKSLFATPLWYLLGAEALAERIYTDRINRYTTIDLQKAKELRAEFEERFKEELRSVIDGIQLSTADICLECNQQVKVVESVP